MRAFLFFGLLLFYFGMLKPIAAQKWVGTWKGTLELGTNSVPLIFYIEENNNLWSATMDSPDQMAYDIRFDEVEPSGQTIELRIQSANALYEGRLSDDGNTIEGTWKQGASFPLILKRSKDERPQRPQEPKPPYPYDVETVTFTNKEAGIELEGTLTLPAKQQHCPAIVLISGSGPQDRDESLLRHKPFWVLADYLTRRGIAVLRYDERGVGASGGTYQGATSADLSTDVEAAYDYLRKHPRVNAKKVGLLGHSEGGLIAPMVASRRPKVAFVVLMAGPGGSGAEVLLSQNNALQVLEGTDSALAAIRDRVLRTLYDQVLADTAHQQSATTFIDALPAELKTLSSEQREKLGLLDLNLRQIISALRGPWLSYFIRSQPHDYLTQVQCPVLVLNGAKDVQVLPNNALAIAQALQDGGNYYYQVNIFPQLNHLFQTAETGLPKEYVEIEETMAPEVLRVVGDWLEWVGR